MIRRGEIAGQREAYFELLVIMELGSVVEGERMKASGMFSEHSASRAGDLIGCARLELLDHRITGFSF